MSITLTIKVSGGEAFSVQVEPEMTVWNLKELCIEKAGVTADKQRLIFKGRIIKDNEVLSALNMEDGNTVHLVRSAVKPASATPSTAPAATPGGVPPPAATPGVQPNAFSPEFMTQMVQGMQGGVGTGMPGIPGMPGMPDIDPQTAAALLNSPMVQEMIQQISNNPHLLRNIVESNPYLQPMVAQNQMLNQMMNNPELIRTMMRPGMLQAGLQMHQAMQQQYQTNQQNPENQTNPPTDPLLNPLFNPLFNTGANPFNPGTNPFNVPVQTDNRPPEERYSSQLQVMEEMGFIDRNANIEALKASGGDVSAAINRLLGG